MVSVPTVCFPADSSWVTSVGGTSLTLTSAGSTLFETGWSDSGDGLASGGGFSHFYPMPSYQKILPTGVQQQFKNQRGIPDVSADEDPATGLVGYVSGQWFPVGGNTSAALWAGLGAIANQMAKHPL